MKYTVTAINEEHIDLSNEFSFIELPHKDTCAHCGKEFMTPFRFYDYSVDLHPADDIVSAGYIADNRCCSDHCSKAYLDDHFGAYHQDNSHCVYTVKPIQVAYVSRVTGEYCDTFEQVMNSINEYYHDYHKLNLIWAIRSVDDLPF